MTHTISSPWPEEYQGAVSLTFDDFARAFLNKKILPTAILAITSMWEKG